MANSRMRSAFTLVEILVAIATLSILILLILQVLSMATKTVSMTEARMDVEGQARTVFATISNDLSHLLKRPDAECIVVKGTSGTATFPNDYIYFYSETAGYFSTSVNAYNRSTLSVIGYRINPATYSFERFAKGLSWDNSSGNTGSPTTGGPVFLTYPASYMASGTLPNTNSMIENVWPTEIPQLSTPADLPTVKTNYQAIGEEIFRMEICFLRTDGTICDQAYLTDPTRVYGLQDVRAVIITVAVINDADRKIVPNMAKLAQAFSKSNLSSPGTTQPTLPATAWMATLNSANFASTAGVPVRVATQLRVYQHFFYLGKN